MAHLYRIPNGCPVIDSYDGSLGGLKCILILLSYVCTHKQIDNELFIPYRTFRNTAGIYGGHGCSYIRNCIKDTIGNNNWIDDYMTVTFGDNGVSVEYTDDAVAVTSERAVNFYQIDIDDVSRFDSVFNLRMYLVYRRNYNRYVQMGECEFFYNSNLFMSMCGCRNRKSVYSMLAKNNEKFHDITGCYICITKHKNPDGWTIGYDDENNDNHILEGE